ncbi:MAG: hypothetical protein AAFR47_00495 [Pseudomonadota bacterium]
MPLRIAGLMTVALAPLIALGANAAEDGVLFPPEGVGYHAPIVTFDGDGVSDAQAMAIGPFPYKARSDSDGMGGLTEMEAGAGPVDPRG